MPTPGYQYLSLGSARSILAARLQDAGIVYYSGGNGAGSAVELNQYIVQAVRCWQAYTASYRQRATFSTSAGVPFYDLNTVLAPACMQHTVTDSELISLMLAMLLEPPLSPTWTGSGMFTFAAIAAALQARLNRFLGDTGLGVSQLTQVAGTGPPVDRIWLSDTVLDVRRAAWVAQSGAVTTLWRDDQYAMQAFYPGGSLAPSDPPISYGTSTLPPVGVQVFPPPANPGQIDLLVVNSGVTVGTTPAAVYNTPTTLNLCDYFTWAVAFGAMADLLGNDSPARDPGRAAYCESRYMEAVQLARMTPSVMLAQINGVPVWTGSVFELDAFMPGWQSAQGQPTTIGMAGRNLAAVATVPDGIYGVSVDVVSNIPVPAADADYLQVDRGNLDPVLDYAQHLAAFKLAGQEFQASEGLHKNFMAAAGVENGRLHQQAFYQEIMLGTRARQSMEVVRV